MYCCYKDQSLSSALDSESRVQFWLRATENATSLVEDAAKMLASTMKESMCLPAGPSSTLSRRAVLVGDEAQAQVSGLPDLSKLNSVPGPRSLEASAGSTPPP